MSYYTQRRAGNVSRETFTSDETINMNDIFYKLRNNMRMTTYEARSLYEYIAHLEAENKRMEDDLK